jgi:hypothetical protein
MMRYWWACALLALASCREAPPSAPADQASSPAPAATASAKAAAGLAQALLDDLVVPRQKGPSAPRDDCAEVPGATEFRTALAAAVLARDADAVAALALPGVKLGFGGDDGRDRLRSRLGEHEGALFREIEALLRLGCAADAEGRITMPWYFAQDYGDVDSYTAMLVTGVDVPLHATADPTSAVKQRLSWDIVSLVEGLAPARPFQQVTTSAGTQGFMPTDRLRSMLDYRLLAVQQGGQWRISALVAGD